MLYANVQRGINTALMERSCVDTVVEPSVAQAGLSDRLFTILDLVSRGRSHSDIVEYFNSTEASIYNDRADILAKTGALNFPHAVSAGAREGVFEPILKPGEVLRVRDLSICLRESVLLAARGLSLAESVRRTKMPTSEGNMSVRRSRAVKALRAGGLPHATRMVLEDQDHEVNNFVNSTIDISGLRV